MNKYLVQGSWLTELPTMGHPFEPDHTKDGKFNQSMYNDAVKEYKTHLASLPKICRCEGLKDGAIVEEGVDYEIRELYETFDGLAGDWVEVSKDYYESGLIALENGKKSKRGKNNYRIQTLAIPLHREQGEEEKWEMFLDESYYDMWAVRLKGDKDFNSPNIFHFVEKREAEVFKNFAEYSKMPERQPAKEDLQPPLTELIKLNTVVGILNGGISAWEQHGTKISAEGMADIMIDVRHILEQIVLSVQPHPSTSAGKEEAHPEAFCQKCGHPNPCWFAENDLWNKVMKGEKYGIVCPVCFQKKADEMNINTIFKGMTVTESLHPSPQSEQAREKELINCLAYALRFWEKEPSFKLYYCSGHVINSHVPITVDGWLPAEDFGYGYFSSAFKDLLNEYESQLLKKYFNV